MRLFVWCSLVVVVCCLLFVVCCCCLLFVVVVVVCCCCLLLLFVVVVCCCCCLLLFVVVVVVCCCCCCCCCLLFVVVDALLPLLLLFLFFLSRANSTKTQHDLVSSRSASAFFLLVPFLNINQCRKDFADEPVCQPQVQQPVQSHHWCRLFDKRSHGGRQTSHNADLGYRWPGALPVAWCCVLPRCRLLRACL